MLLRFGRHGQSRLISSPTFLYILVGGNGRGNCGQLCFQRGRFQLL